MTLEFYVQGVATGIKGVRKLGVGGDVGSMSLSGIIAMNSGNAVNLRANSDGSTIEITVVDAQFTLSSA